MLQTRPEQISVKHAEGGLTCMSLTGESRVMRSLAQGGRERGLLFCTGGCLWFDQLLKIRHLL